MDFAAIRSRLAGADGRLYWRSLGELADTSEFRDYLHREFPEQASEWNDAKGRRNFLKLMSASLALAGVGACTKQPPENIRPYVRQPEDIVPGRPLFFASAIPLSGVAQPVLVESHMGRPTKIEGNPDHPASLGATDVLTQAAVLGLYDPDRAQTVTYRSEVRPWSTFQTAMQTALEDQKKTQGAGLRILTEPITSPALSEVMATILRDYPQAKWHQFDPVASDGTRTGAPGRAIYHFDKADVVLSLESDFLCTGPGNVRYARDYADRRRVVDRDPKDTTEHRPLNRLYMVESTPTLTGAKAEHRLPVRAAEVETFARRLAGALGAGAAQAASQDPLIEKWVTAVAKDLQEHKGRSLVVAGEFQPASVYALAHTLNTALGNVGTTVTYGAQIEAQPIEQHASLRELATAMDAGQVQVLLILGNNPVFTAPADLNFGDRLAKVGLVVYHSLYADETSMLSHWMVPDTHPLETWGDPRAYDGTVTIMQPLIQPLYESHSAYEVLATLTTQPGRKALEIVKDYWTRAFGGATGWTIRNAQGESFSNADAFWKQVVHDGYIPNTATTQGGPATPFVAAGAAAAPAAQAAAAPATPATSTPATPPQAGGLEIVFRPDPTVWDGRFANNGWLQELPKPLSKMTWDTCAWIGLQLAEERELRNGDVIELRYRGQTAKMPVYLMAGHPNQSVTVFLGYGRRLSGRVGTASAEAQGFNAYLLRTSDAPWFGAGLEISKTGDRYLLATTQEHHAMEGRYPARVVTIDEYEKDHSVVKHMQHTFPKTLTLYEDHEYTGNKWGMSIDLNACNGCGACIVACVSENNIPVVGKEQVNKNREMHWIRVDHYFTGSIDHPESVQAVHQPMPCQQCENAPCEVVCPVAATTHSAEGLNDMVYNRCVGTRYCSNNCPYKVRRFNFLLYSDWETQSYWPMRNPDVTVRSRGVMEKCTYCVQRINTARIDAKKEGRDVRDGEAACPSEAIVFGNLNDPNSRVAKLQGQNRSYGVLEELNTRPRTTYLAALRNPNPELEPAAAGQRPTGH
jgi:MoCo/4Fe-4S cofactor protein with predicted Tat translocation signal